MRQLLRKFGFNRIDEAANGQSALNLYTAHKHPLIFMDCQMPGMDGMEATRTIRAMSSNISAPKPVIIAVTADAMKGANEKCLEAGMNDYISKPVDTEKLSELLEKWVPHSIDKKPDQKLHSAEKTKSNLHILNPSTLSDFSEADQDIEQNIISVFIENLHHDMDVLAQSLASSDYEQWLISVHKLYGSSANMGAERMADICDKAQILSAHDFAEIQSHHHNIVIEYKNILSALQPQSLKIA